MAKRFIILAALALFSGLGVQQSHAVQDGFWLYTKGKVRFAAINPQGDLFVYVVLGDPDWIPKIQPELNGGTGDNGVVFANDLEISNIRMEGEMMVGLVQGASEDGTPIDGERNLAEIFIPDYANDGWITAEENYNQVMGGSCP